MKVKALVRDLKMFPAVNGKKHYAICTIETEAPLEIIELRLFAGHIDNNTANELQKCKGRVVEIPLQMEEYNGKTNLKFPMNEAFVAPPVTAK